MPIHCHVMQVVTKTVNYISSRAFARWEFNELKGSTECIVRKLGDDHTCSVKRVAKHRQPRRSERYGFGFWVEEKKENGTTSEVTNSEIKLQGGWLKKEHFIKREKNIMIGKVKKSPNGTQTSPQTYVKFTTRIRV